MAESVTRRSLVQARGPTILSPFPSLALANTLFARAVQRAIAFRYRSGVALVDAIEATLNEVKRLGGDAGVIAVTSDGEIAIPYNSQDMKRASVSVDSTLTVATFG